MSTERKISWLPMVADEPIAETAVFIKLVRDWRPGEILRQWIPLAMGLSKTEVAELVAEVSRLTGREPGLLMSDLSDAKAKQIKLTEGKLPEVVDCCLAVVRLDGQIYQRGGELVYVSDGQIYQVTPDYLRVYLSSIARFERADRRGFVFPADCPKELAAAVLAQRGFWGLPELRGVITAPVLTPAGRLIAKSGLDKETGLLLLLPPGYVCRIPEEPTEEDARRALEMLLHPFMQFPFVGPVDWGVMLAALLTAVVRPALPTAPGVLFDSPTAGTGKTLLTSCVAFFAGMSEPEMMPGTNGDENEFRKRLFAGARSSKPVMAIDNIAGHLESAALCAFLTSKTYSDRLLGQSLNLAFPVVSFVILNGNNARLVGDLNRRVLRCRIDPLMERPDQRAFDLNPAEYVRTHRMPMVEAALILLRAFKPTAPGRMASFEEWSDFVRQAVVWAGGLGVVQMADPVESIDVGYALDPETQKLAALLEAWWAAFEDKPATVAEVVRNATNTNALFDAIDEIAGERNTINPRRFGRWIERHAGRIVDELRFERTGIRDKVAIWQVRGRKPSGRSEAAEGF